MQSLRRAAVEAPAFRLFQLANADEHGCLLWHYEHEGRAPVLVKTDVETKKIQYTNVSGEETDWHGECSERMHYDVEMGHVCHQIRFEDFHSPHGILSNVVFTQVGPKCWRGRHPRNREVIHMTLMEPNFRENVRTITSDSPIPLGDKPRGDAIFRLDDDNIVWV